MMTANIDTRSSSSSNGNNKMIGGTIAVPRTVDNTMDISCRSDLTQDLISEIDRSCNSRTPYYNNQPVPTLLKRVSSHNSFHTAAAFNNSDGGLRLNDDGEDEDADNAVDDDDSMAELDEQAEQAARECFGGDADRVLDEPPRRSTLVSENASIDVSWFASRGLMSRRSFERYQKEMKKNVIRGASSNNNLKSSGSRRKIKNNSRRASISMGDLRNEEWSYGAVNAVKTADANDSGKRNNIGVVSNMKPKPRSVDDLDQLCKENDDGLDQLLKSFISAIKPFKSELVTTNDTTAPKKNEVANSNGPTSTGLNSKEIDVLAKMMRRLSEDGDKPFENDDLVDSSIHGDRNTNNNISDLMDSSTWNTKSANQDDTASCVSRDYSIEDRNTKPIVQRTSSSRTLKVSNESSDAISKLAFKYAPKRSSSIDLKGLKSSQVREVDFESDVNHQDSFHTTLGERNDTLSSISIALDDIDSDDESTSELDSPPIRKPRGNTSGSISPRKRSFERSDTGSTISSKSPSIVQARTYQVQHRGGSEDFISCTNTLDMPQFERDQSVPSLGPSASSECAVASGDLTKDDSFSASCTMPHQGDQGQSHPMHHWRGESSGTDCAVTDTHRKMDRFEKSTGHASPRSNTGRPTRRNSIASSHSSVGEGLSMIRNSFSSLFTARVDLDSLEGPPLKEDCGDILQEGMEYLSISMLVNIYAKLRELSTLGHASVKLVDIDVNSHQSLARKKEMLRLGLLEAVDNESYLKNTKTAGAIVRTVLDEYEMFEASNELTTTFSNTNRANMMYDASLLSEFKTWVEESKVKQLDSVTEEVINTLRKECSQRQMYVKESSSNDSLSTMERANVRLSIAKRRGSLIAKSNSFQDATWLEQERKLIADHFGVQSSVPASGRNCDVRRHSRRISRGVLTESMIERTLDKSHDYFEEGSSLRNLLETGLEVVWFSDRHPDDIIYCICVNRATATVAVVFRGQEGLFDLFKDSSISSYPNPIMHEDYEGNSEFINLRAAVSDEMMRVRRDTKKSTIDEIRDKVEQIGKELTDGGRYHLSVTGHSLGGGLACVAGFYLASDPSLELASAVRVFTFASARVGCKAFQRGFKHLEETGRLQLARFTNSNEVVSLLPASDVFHHVGMHICLHKANSAGRQRTRQSLDVSYSSDTSRLGGAVHFLLNCFSALKSSRISEYQLRMHFAREYRRALGDGVLRFDKKRNHLKTLNDYYLMKLRLVDYMGFTKKNEMPSFLVFFLVSCLISFEIALLFKFVAMW